MKKIYKTYRKIEFLIFKTLLKRFINKDLDQFERWEMDSKYGKCYISIARQSDGYKYEKLD
jgi:hypothetical protein